MLIFIKGGHNDSLQATQKLKTEVEYVKVYLINGTGPIMITVAYFKYTESLKESGKKNNSMGLPTYGFYNALLVRQDPLFNQQCLPDSKKHQSYKLYDGIGVGIIVADPLCGAWNSM